MAKTITVSSFKGGTAKTSTSLHVGAALAKFHHKRVLLIDFDAQANLTMGLGLDPDSLDSMAPVLQGTKKLEEVIQQTAVKGLDIVPADTWLERIEVTGALASDRYSHEKLRNILADADYDFILIDTPPSLCWLTESALIAATESIICTTAEFYSVKGLERLSTFMSTISERHPMRLLGVVLSFWNARGKSNSSFLNVIERSFPGKCFNSKIRKDISVSEASLRGKPLFELQKSNNTTRAYDDYKALTSEMLERLCQLPVSPYLVSQCV
jgi:chromosome partitioning protein